MPISREIEIESRRDRVLQLASTGLTQMEIAAKLNYSQQTISNDLAFLRRKATENIAKYTEGIAFQHGKVKANLELIIREGWQLYERITDDKRKVMLFSTLKDVNESLLQVDAVGDIIRQEMMAESQQAIDEAREELEAMEQEEQEQQGLEQQQQEQQQQNG